MPKRAPRKKIALLLDNGRWMLAYAWRHAGRWLLMLIGAALVAAALPALTAIAARALIDAIFDAVGAQADPAGGERVLLWLGASVAVAALGELIHAMSAISGGRFRRRLHQVMTLDIMTHGSRLDLTVFENPIQQDMMARIQDNMAEHAARFLERLITAGTGVLSVIALIGVVMAIDPLVIVLLAPVMLVRFVADWRQAERTFRLNHEQTNAYRWTGYYSYHLLNFQSVPETRLLDLASTLIARYHAVIDGVLSAAQKLDDRQIALDLGFSLLTLGAFYAAFARVVTRALAGTITVGDAVVYGQVALTLQTRFQAVSKALTSAYQETLYMDDLRAFFALAPACPTPLDTPTAAAARLDIEHIGFTYPGQDRPTLAGVSFSAAPGEIVAVMGANGAGKSTLVKLLAGLYTPTEGAIRLNGVDTRTIEPGVYLRHLSILFQIYNLYEGSVHDNIAFGDHARLLDDRTALRDHAERVGVGAMIAGLPNGYDTQVGLSFHHYTLSGGQWQRLALARVLAKQAPILILDEPTASMDAESEYALFEYLRATAAARTTLLISHRFSTLSLADRVVVLEEGRIVEQGSHTDLIAGDGIYARAYRLYERHI